MQNVAPGETTSRQPDLLRGSGNRVAIGDMEHARWLAQWPLPFQNCHQCQNCQKSPELEKRCLTTVLFILDLAISAILAISSSVKLVGATNHGLRSRQLRLLHLQPGPVSGR